MATREEPENIAESTISNLKQEGVEIETSDHTEDNEFTDTEQKEPVAKTVGMDAEMEALLNEKPASPSSVPQPTPVLAKETVAPQPFTRTPEPSVRPEPAPSASANNPAIRQLRTFKMDAEEAVRYNNVSAADIAIAEHKKREATPIQYVEPSTSKIWMWVVVVCIVLSGAIGAGTFFYIKGNDAGITQSNEKFRLPSLIPYQALTPVSPVGNSAIEAIAAAGTQVQGQVGSVIYLPILDTSTTTRQLSIRSVLNTSRAPDRLIRSLSGDYMFGIHVFDGKAPFIILKTNFFQNAFPGMLEWEKDMRNDLISLIRISRPNIVPVTTNTDVFRDRILSNIDVRELVDESGATIVMYAFTDKDTILITTTEKSMRELITALLSVRVVQ